MTERANKSAQRNQDGIILVSVLWIVVLLGLLITAFSASVRSALTVARTGSDMAMVQSAADAGTELAVARLILKGRDRWVPDGRAYSVNFEGQTLVVQIFDTNGFLDINYASREVLLPVLQRFTGSTHLGRSLHDFIMERRKQLRSSGRRTAAGEEQNTEQLHRKLIFRDISELLEVPGMDRKILARLKSILTVHSAGKGLNLMTAPVELLQSLPGMTRQQLRQIVEARALPAASGRAAISGLSTGGKLASKDGPAYKIKVTVRNPKFAAGIPSEATVLLGAEKHVPYRTLNWSSIGY